MQIYTKYIIRNLLVQFITVALTLTSIVWITQSMRILDLMVSKGISFIDFLQVSALLVPYIIFIIIPISLFFASLFSIYKLSSDRELIIFKSIGLSNLQISKPIIYFALGITMLCYSISFYFLPLTYGKFKDLQVYFRNNYVSILLEEGVFSSQVRNLTVYVDEKVDENTYLGILVYDNRKPEKPKVITAQKGKLIRQDSEVWFELYHGSHQDKNIKAGQISLLYFDKYSLNLNFFDEDYIRSIEANERYVHELFNLRNVDKTQKNKLLSHGHFRISWPLNALALVSLAAAVMIAGRYHRKDRLYRNITLGFVGCGVLVIYILFNNLSLYNPYIAIFMYLTPLSVMVSSMIYLRGSRLKLEKK